MEYPFIAITPRSTQTQSGSMCRVPLYLKIIRISLNRVQKKKFSRNNYL